MLQWRAWFGHESPNQLLSSYRMIWPRKRGKRAEKVCILIYSWSPSIIYKLSKDQPEKKIPWFTPLRPIFDPLKPITEQKSFAARSRTSSLKSMNIPLPKLDRAYFWSRTYLYFISKSHLFRPYSELSFCRRYRVSEYLCKMQVFKTSIFIRSPFTPGIEWTIRRIFSNLAIG